MTPYNQTCKFCDTPATYWGEICPQCKPIYEKGFRAGVNHVVKETRQELQNIIRRLESMEIK